MKFLEKVDRAKGMIERVYSQYGNQAAVACSFGKDSMVVLHMCLDVYPKFPVFSVMTPFKPNVTWAYKEAIEYEWDLNIKTYQQSLSPLHTGMGETIPLWISDPDSCCRYYKVEPMRRAIEDMNLDVWITGLRRDEGRTRTNYEHIEPDGDLIKLNPILDFTEKDVWRYLALNGIPVNPLYLDGYRSLGCEPCSTPEKDENETERAGRWQGTSKCGGECGIHTQSMKGELKVG